VTTDAAASVVLGTLSHPLSRLDLASEIRCNAVESLGEVHLE